jgi:hypothetical protein
MLRPLTRADLQPGDILLQRLDSLATLPPFDPGHLFGEFIGLGETVIEAMSVKPGPVTVFHVAVVEDPATSQTLEEEPSGAVSVPDEQTDARWDVYRTNLTPAQIPLFIAALRARLGQRYGWEDFPLAAGIRIFKIPVGHPDYTAPADCSVDVAEAFASIGVYPWSSRGIDPIAVVPSDFPGDGMTIIARAGVLIG